MTKEPTDLDRWNELGPQIAFRYTQLGMTQTAFCKAAGVSGTYWRPIERGKATNVPRDAKLAGIARAIHVEPGELLAAVRETGVLPDSRLEHSELEEVSERRVATGLSPLVIKDDGRAVTEEIEAAAAVYRTMLAAISDEISLNGLAWLVQAGTWWVANEGMREATGRGVSTDSLVKFMEEPKYLEVKSVRELPELAKRAVLHAWVTENEDWIRSTGFAPESTSE